VPEGDLYDPAPASPPHPPGASTVLSTGPGDSGAGSPEAERDALAAKPIGNRERAPAGAVEPHKLVLRRLNAPTHWATLYATWIDGRPGPSGLPWVDQGQSRPVPVHQPRIQSLTVRDLCASLGMPP
jgi:hypothetical protein